MTPATLRRDLVTRPILSLVGAAMPALSDTEAQAIEAGDTWLDATLFTGHPDWDALLAVPAPALTAEEQAFLDGPVAALCAMVDPWDIASRTRDLPAEAWDLLKRERFFGMIIPKEYGGLGFSAFAHSEVVRTITTRSLTAAVTAMVPNSLGPGELLMTFGTEAQKRHWLPRLADGREIPCFGLTSPEAGSDAAAMTDTGVVCMGEWQGAETLGIRLNWRKRYITLGPVATVLGLAFKLSDPDGLIGDTEQLGITVALIPTDLPGVEIGRRHLPAGQAFQNGPTSGHDVFVPMELVIGGQARVGQGWAMLMSALAAGRGISLPSQAAASAAYSALVTGAYARVREQFGLPIAAFEGVQERLARIAGTAYMLDGARRLTCAGLDMGHHPAVLSSIMKLHATERMRTTVNDAMDVHGGKAVIDGPSNYLAESYRGVPVAITVEGANILTRSLMVFGQGAIRAHPYLLGEIRAVGEADGAVALTGFDAVLWKHVVHALKTAIRSFARSWTGGLVAPAPKHAGRMAPYFRALSRYAAGFALIADVAFLTMGGALKRRELLSARLGDILSELYLLSAVLKRWDEEGRIEADWPLARYCLDEGLKTIEDRFDEAIANLPHRGARWMLRLFILPFGRTRRGPPDWLVRKVARLVSEPGATRDRLTRNVHVGAAGQPVAELIAAFDAVTATQPLRDRLRRAGIKDWRQAERFRLPDGDRAALEAAEAAVARVIAVDDFAADELAVAPVAGGADEPARLAPA